MNRRVRRIINVLNSNPKGCNQYKKCAAGGGVKVYTRSELEALDGQALKHLTQDFGVYGGGGASWKAEMIDRILARQSQEQQHRKTATKIAAKRESALSEWEADLPKYTEADLRSEYEQHKLKGRTLQMRSIESEAKRRRVKL